MKEITKEELENCGESFITFHFSTDKKVTEKMMYDLDRTLLRGVKHWCLIEEERLHVALNDERDFCISWSKGFMAGWSLVTKK